MAQTLEHTEGAGRPSFIVAVLADREAAAAAAQALRNAGVEDGSIQDAGGSPAHPALARLPEADRQAVSSAVAAHGAVLVVACRSQAEHDRALSVLNRQAGGSMPAADAPTALPDGIRGTTRDVDFTEPKEEHAGHGDTFSDRMRDRSPGRGAGTGLYIVHGD